MFRVWDSLYRGNHSTHFRTAETGICERFDTDRRRTDEPENQAVLLKLVQAVRHTFGTKKDVWCYTGCVLESELLSESSYRCDVTDALLSEIDVLVDGPFIEEEKSLQLAFRGSMNQRILRKQNGRFVVSET